MKTMSVLLFCFMCFSAFAWQPGDTIISKKLHEVTVKAYAGSRMLQQLPAAVNYIGNKELNRFNNTTILPALNATPGVRMEERSPGSYRLSVRGSSLRAPFGVRNVKVYYNEIPFTDPGGNTSLNQLGFYNITSAEVIKGPAGSMYGAGTGGTLLLESLQQDWSNGFKAGYSGGSNNMHHLLAEVRFGRKSLQNTIRYQRLSTDGYRQHTNMRRDVLSWDALLKASAKNKLSAHFLYSDLYYQTPGALTLTEYNNTPRNARPAAGAFPGAIQARAAIYSNGFLSGLTNTYAFGKRFQNTTTIYGIYNRLRNPTIQNYGINTEPHFGGRTRFDYNTRIGRHRIEALAGAELQQGISSIRTYKNREGNPDTLLLDDELNNQVYFAFAQLSWRYRKWSATAGLSSNHQRLDFARLNAYPYQKTAKTFNNNIAPRFALLFRENKNVSWYVNLAKGFSPPTTAELLPSGLNFNPALKPEEGWNYELGVKGYLFERRLSYDISAFTFALNNTIVVRRDAGGGNYFINAGGAEQLGIESYLKYNMWQSNVNVIESANVFGSYSWYRFKYKNFMQDKADYSGNHVPGITPHTLTLGLNIDLQPGIYLSATWNYTDKMALNDANTIYAVAFNLLGARLGYRVVLNNRYTLDVFTGVDNLLNEKYSLGNDINGFAGRYYNLAPALNVYYGLILGFEP